MLFIKVHNVLQPFTQKPQHVLSFVFFYLLQESDTRSAGYLTFLLMSDLTAAEEK